MKNKLLTLGVGGTIFAMLCCFKPLLPIALTALGLTGLLNVLYNDAVLLPILAGFLALTGYALWRQKQKKVILESTLTCPSCGHVETETMPTDACHWFYECKSCHTVLKPLEGDCCVYCSYATVPCPPIQEGKPCC